MHQGTRQPWTFTGDMRIEEERVHEREKDVYITYRFI
jgi:hypothetical protein